MNLRSVATRASLGSRQSGARLGAALTAALLLLLAPLAGRARADATDYPSPLWLSGIAATQTLTSSYKLISSAGPGLPTTAPTATVVAGAGIPTGSYTYVYTYVDAGGETPPSPVSNTATTTAGNQQIRVDFPAGIPAGVSIRLYRLKSSLYNLVTTLPGTTTTYTDSANDPPSSTVLPQSQNRIALFGTGFADFSPGGYVGVSNNSSTAATASITAMNQNKGWIVDGPGSVTFPTGDWTFYLQTKSGVSTNGTGHLVVGMWKVTSAGLSVGAPPPLCSSNPAAPCTLVNPNSTNPNPSTWGGENTATNVVNNTNTLTPVTHPVYSVPAFSLAAGEHLYVQFWRRQTGGYTSGTTAARVVTLYAYGGVGRITHPAASTLPNDPPLVAPADGTSTNALPQLRATFADPDAGDTGVVNFRVCTASAVAGAQCSGLAASGSSASTANGADGTWTVSSPLSDGTYYWQAQNQDATGGQSGWTATRSFVLDTAAPDTAITANPPDPTNATSASFSFSSSEPSGATFECRLDGGVFTACTSPAGYTGLANGSHTFEVRAYDQAGNVDPSPATYAWTVDTAAPDTSITAGPADPSNDASPSFSFSSTKPSGATFECRLDAGAFTPCTSPSSYPGLSDGSHTFEVRAHDAAGNVDPTPATYTWTKDTAAPETTIGSKPANPANSATASLSFASSEPAGATYECRLDGAGFAACTVPQSYSGLSDGSHTFEVRAHDAAGNVDATPAAYTWSVDTTSPGEATLVAPVDGRRSQASPQLSATFADVDPADTGTIEFRVCADRGCSDVLTGGSSAVVANGASGDWTAGVLPEGAYYWQARSRDAAGNESSWAAVRTFVIDRSAPGAPIGVDGLVTVGGLTIFWRPPSDEPMSGYVVLADGVPIRQVDGSTTDVSVGPFDAGDMRSFAVAAIDAAGNPGPASGLLVGVPSLYGLTPAQARDALAARGLRLAGPVTRDPTGLAESVAIVQIPSAPAVIPAGSSVAAVFSVAPPGTRGRLIQIGRIRRQACGRRNVVHVRLWLRTRALVSVKFVGRSGRVVGSRSLGSTPPGTTDVDLPLPRAAARGGQYWLVLTAKANKLRGRATALVPRRPSGSGRADSVGCRATPTSAQGAGSILGPDVAGGRLGRVFTP